MVTLQDMADALDLKPKKDHKGFAAYGEIKSINPDNTYQVSLNGSDTTVKCARLTGAHVGDVVLVNVLDNGYAVVTGCVGGDTDALEALEQSGATVQHFWYDAYGAHVTEDTQEDYLNDPTNAGGNTLITMLGMAIRKGTTELARFADNLLILGKRSSKNVRLETDGLGLYYGDSLQGRIGYDNYDTAQRSITFKTNTTASDDAYSAVKLRYGNGTSELFLEAQEVSNTTPILMRVAELSNLIQFSGYRNGVRQGGATIYGDGSIYTEGTLRGVLEEPTVSITATKGTLVAAQARRFGHVVQLWIQYRNTSSIAGGQNVFEGTLNTTALRPVMSSSGTGYFGEHAMVGFLTTAGAITIRNAASTAVMIPSTSTSSVVITYLVN